jgi:uncharacterized protein
MQVFPRRISPQGTTETGEDPADALELKHEPGIQALGPVQYDLHLQLVSHELVARGTVSARLNLQCARCAQWFEQEITEPDFLEVVPVLDLDASVDLTPLLREAIFLALSANPVCRPQCRGLCSHCGADLNEGPCRCPPGAGDRRWSALGDIELK